MLSDTDFQFLMDLYIKAELEAAEQSVYLCVTHKEFMLVY